LEGWIDAWIVEMAVKGDAHPEIPPPIIERMMFSGTNTPSGTFFLKVCLYVFSLKLKIG